MNSLSYSRSFLSGPTFSGGEASDLAVASKIISFEDLPVGWHFGEGGPAETHVIDAALDVYWFLQSQGLCENDAFAGANGEVLVTAYRGPHYIGIIVEADGNCSFRHEFGDDDVEYFETDSLDKIKDAITRASRDILLGETWSTSATFIPKISSLLEVDSMSFPLSVTGIEPYQLLNETASNEMAA